jgi:transposase
MIDRRIVFEIHKLRDSGLSLRQIARKLRLNRITVKKYMEHPEKSVIQRTAATSKLSPYYEMLEDFLRQDPDVHAPVVLQRLQAAGFDGKITIVRDYLREKRKSSKAPQAFIRFESPPGKQIQIDWGHFDSLSYGNAKRKLYVMSMTEAHSRMLFVQFTHSQKQEVLQQSLMNGFKFFGGTSAELVFDNMLTAVTERVGHIIRFNEFFLDFLRILHMTPVACNVRAPYEKGKIESTIGYIRKNFWPLRSFKDLGDVQRQANEWRDTVANQRIHETTGEKPADRFQQARLRPLPELLPDLRETCQLKVHKDFEIHFDGNRYTVPPTMIGKNITLKADHETIMIYYKEKRVAVHDRCWSRNQRIENPAHTESVRKLQKQLWKDRQIQLFSSLGDEAVRYLESLAEAGRPIKSSISRLLALKDEYGTASLLHAINKALSFKAYGVDYIENILYQEMTPESPKQPVRLKNEALNRLRLAQPMLEDYDAYILERRKNDD